jgi:Nickel responsive protein SCO4226-like
MKALTNQRSLLIAILLFVGYASTAQSTTASSNSKTTNATKMKTYLIERDIPDAGKLTPEQLKAISQKSCDVLKDMGPSIQWIQSYVTGDKIYCVYKAENEELIKEHAKKGGFPANSIMEIATVISPATAEN